MENTDALALIFERNAFYKRMHMLALGAFVFNLVAITLLLLVIFYLSGSPTQPLFFAADSYGRLIEIKSIDKPNMTDDEAANWVTEAVQAAYSYDYINYRLQLQGAQKYFTNTGWSNYMQQLSASNNLIALTQRKMIFYAQVTDKPKILAKGLLNGAYTWKMELPLLVTYMLPPYDDKSKFYNPLTVTVVAQQQPILQSYLGLGIVQLYANIVTNQTAAPQEISGTSTGQ